MVLTAAAIWIGVTDSDWPKAIRSSACSVHSAGSGRMPGDSASRPDVGAPAETERVEVGAQLALLEPVGGQHGADVGGLGQDAGQREPDLAVLEVVVDDPVLAGQAARHGELRARGHPAGVDQRGEGEHLLDRAGLVGQVDRPGPAVLGRVVGRVGRVERRVVGVGEDLAGPRVHDHRDPGVAAGLAHRVAQDPLGVPLQVAVDGRGEVRAVDGLGGLVGAQRDPVAAADLVAGRAVLAGEVPVEDLLQAAERLVGAHEPDQVGGHVVGRVGADRVAPGGQALDAAGLGLGDARRWRASTAPGGRRTRTGCPWSRSRARVSM